MKEEVEEEGGEGGRKEGEGEFLRQYWAVKDDDEVGGRDGD